MLAKRLNIARTRITGHVQTRRCFESGHHRGGGAETAPYRTTIFFFMGDGEQPSRVNYLLQLPGIAAGVLSSQKFLSATRKNSRPGKTKEYRLGFPPAKRISEKRRIIHDRNIRREARTLLKCVNFHQRIAFPPTYPPNNRRIISCACRAHQRGLQIVARRN